MPKPLPVLVLFEQPCHVNAMFVYQKETCDWRLIKTWVLGCLLDGIWAFEPFEPGFGALGSSSGARLPGTNGDFS